MDFDRFAGNYEQTLGQALAVSGEGAAYYAAYKAKFLQRTLTRSFAGRILDFGCGVGLLSGFLGECFPEAQIDGFDVSAASIERVPSAIRMGGLFTSNTRELAQDYQLIVIANVLHHVLPQSRQALLRELGGRLAANGILSIFEHNPRNPLTRRVVERCPFDEDAVLLCPAEVKGYLRAANLRLLRHDYIVFFPHALGWLRFVEPWLAWLPAGAQYAVLAEKHA
jgi:SAM-dependent methyltransferase